jgi:phosphate-selective porin OprO and OprP
MRLSFVSWPSGLAVAAFAVAIGFGPLPAMAESAAAKQSVQEQIDELKQQIEALEKANAAIPPMVDEKITKEYLSGGFNLKDGFFLQDYKGEYKIKFRGYTQLDGRFFIGDPNNLGTDQFLFRRVRPVLEGSLTKYVDFKIMPDFAGSSFQLFDAYVDLKPLIDEYKDLLKIRVGKYKAPLGLERLQSATAIALVERGAPTNLVPTRDIGIELWGNLLDRRFRGTPWSGIIGYELGVFDGAPDLGNVNGNLGDDFTFAGRVFVQPFATWSEGSEYDVVRGLGIGIGGSWGDVNGSQSNPDLPSYRSFSQNTVFSYVTGSDAATTAISDGTLSRWNPQAYWYWGPFGAFFEYVQSTTPVKLGDTKGDVRNNAWQITGSWVITGDPASYKGVSPVNPFNPWNGKWGALEVVARYDELDIDDNAFDLGFANPTRSIRSFQGFGGGLNWYWSNNIKIVLDYYHTHFEGGASGGTGNRPTEDVIITRVQLNL